MNDFQRIIPFQHIRIRRCDFDQQAGRAEGDFYAVQRRRLVVEGDFQFVLIGVAGHQKHLALIAVAAEHGHVVFFVIAGVGDQVGGGHLHQASPGAGRAKGDFASLGHFLLRWFFQS
ncbi:hypothetical protein D3C81_1902470 [compost metagenome]